MAHSYCHSSVICNIPLKNIRIIIMIADIIIIYQYGYTRCSDFMLVVSSVSTSNSVSVYFCSLLTLHLLLLLPDWRGLLVSLSISLFVYAFRYVARSYAPWKQEREVQSEEEACARSMLSENCFFELFNNYRYVLFVSANSVMYVVYRYIRSIKYINLIYFDVFIEIDIDVFIPRCYLLSKFSIIFCMFEFVQQHEA